MKEELQRQIEAIERAITRLILKRRKEDGNHAEQENINGKLDKLYDIKFLTLQRLANVKQI